LSIEKGLEHIFENYFALYDFKMETRLVHLRAYLIHEEALEIKEEKKTRKIV
jgi:hypothetical protein